MAGAAAAEAATDTDTPVDEQPVIDINAALAHGETPEPSEGADTDDADAEDELADLLVDGLKLTPEQVRQAAERVRKAAAQAKKLRAESHKLWGASEKRAKKVMRREADYQANARMFAGERDQFVAAWSAVRSGDAKTTLEGLRTLTGRDPVQVLEELNLHIASNGKRRELTPQERELQEKLTRIERTLEMKAANEEQQKIDSFIAQRKTQLAQSASESAEQFPLLSDYAQENPQAIGDALAEIIVEGGKRGEKIGDANAMRILEEHLNELSQRALKRKNGTAGSGPEHGTGTPSQKANPGQASKPALKGKSLSVSSATAASAKRELTEEELQEDAANFLPASLVNWARGTA